MVITNKDTKAFEFELLMHTYLRVKVRLSFPVGDTKAAHEWEKHKLT